ncbi:MAG: DUF58 domain-containing protein, partial [Candidatus Omnitrophica bacterium]|nr:DUF58 domain-containing protein [Candidatus Omnitrophota bacterium]
AREGSESRAPAPAAVRAALRSVRGRQSALSFFDRLSQLTAQGAANLNAALRRGALEAKQTGLAVVLSDFLDPAGYESGLGALLGRGFQINVVQILSPEELNPTTYGDLKLVDSETGEQREVTFGRYRLKAYRRTVENFCAKLREYCRRRGINYFLAGSDTPLEDLLLKQLRRAEVWK